MDYRYHVIQTPEVWGIGLAAFVITAIGYGLTSLVIYHPWVALVLLGILVIPWGVGKIICKLLGWRT